MLSTELEASNVLIKVEGMTHYELVGEGSTVLAYNLVDCICHAYSLLLIGFLCVWVRARLLTFFWLVKVGIFVASTLLAV